MAYPAPNSKPAYGHLSLAPTCRCAASQVTDGQLTGLGTKTAEGTSESSVGKIKIGLWGQPTFDRSFLSTSKKGQLKCDENALNDLKQKISHITSDLLNINKCSLLAAQCKPFWNGTLLTLWPKGSRILPEIKCHGANIWTKRGNISLVKSGLLNWLLKKKRFNNDMLAFYLELSALITVSSYSPPFFTLSGNSLVAFFFNDRRGLWAEIVQALHRMLDCLQFLFFPSLSF